jgi:hypothetical protein
MKVRQKIWQRHLRPSGRNTSEVVYRYFLKKYLIHIIFTMSSLSLFGQGSELGWDEKIDDWYLEFREAYSAYFTFNTSISQEGVLTNDGIGEWLDTENRYSCWGEGLSATAIKFNGGDSRLKYGGDSGLNLGKKIALLSMEYAWLKDEADPRATTVLQELFLALQAYRRLDMTANQLLLKYYRFIRQETCFEQLTEQGIRLDGYTGFFIRDDLWFTLASKGQEVGTSPWYPRYADGALLDAFRKLEKEGACNERDGNFIFCFQDLLDFHLFNSQDQIIGLMHGLAFAKRFISQEEFVEVKGERFYIRNLVHNISNALWIKTKSCSRSMRIPNCQADCDSWKHGTGSNTKAFQKGITQIYNYISNDFHFPSFIDHYLFGISLPISRLQKTTGNSRFNIRMFLKLKAAGDLECDCAMLDDALAIGYFPAIMEHAILYDKWELMNQSCGSEQSNKTRLRSEMEEVLFSLEGQLPCFISQGEEHVPFTCPDYSKDFGWCQGGPLEYNDVACSNATTSIYSPVDFLYMYWLLKWEDRLNPQ